MRPPGPHHFTSEHSCRSTGTWGHLPPSHGRLDTEQRHALPPGLDVDPRLLPIAVSGGRVVSCLPRRSGEQAAVDTLVP